jgi:transcriptional regulator with XRE-family HTH domain
MPRSITSREPFPARLRRLRERAGYSSPGALARAAGLGEAICYRLETPVANPTLSTLTRLAKALGVPVGELAGN